MKTYIQQVIIRHYWLKLIHFSDNVAFALISISTILSDNVEMPPKRSGGIRNRVEKSEALPPKRARAESAASSSVSRPLSGGIRQRVTAAQSSTDSPQIEGTPLANVMKKNGEKEKRFVGKREKGSVGRRSLPRARPQKWPRGWLGDWRVEKRRIGRGREKGGLAEGLA